MPAKNPLGLKRKTHVLAKKHIDYFKDKKGLVHVYRKDNGRLIPVKPDVDGMFNVNGLWSHHAEGRMGLTEVRFWELLDAFHACPSAVDQGVVSEYFALWCARGDFARSPPNFEPPAEIDRRDLKRMVIVTDDQGREVSATQEDLGEQRGVGFNSTDANASARSISWPLIKWLMDTVAIRIECERIRWGAVKVLDATLILPDRPTDFDIPISPHWFLHGYREQEEFLPVCTASPGVATSLNQCWFDNAYQVVVASSPEVLRALIPTG